MKNKKLILSLTFLASLLLSGCNIFSNSSESPSSQAPTPSSSAAPSSSSAAPSSSSSSQTSSSSSSSSSAASSSSSSSSSSEASSSETSSSSSSSSTPAPTTSSEPAPTTSSEPAPTTSTGPAPTTSSSSSSSSSTSTSTAPEFPPEPTGNGFSNISDDIVFEIHTAAQKTYLSYAGQYETIPEDQYPSGSTHQSDSNPVTMSWNYTAPAGKTVSNYNLIYGQNSDLSDGYTLTTTTKSLSFYNPYLGKNYYRLVANFTDSTSEQTDIRWFNVDTTYPRNLTIGGMTNCRDLGGRVTEDGGIIKQGCVYRTSGKKYDYSTVPTSEGIDEMLNHLGFKTEVNVADNDTYTISLTGTYVKNYYMDYSGGSHHFSRNAESVKNFFTLLADTNNYPVFFHCRIGTDRTGLCAILLDQLLTWHIKFLFPFL